MCRTEVIIYLVERSPNGTSKRVPASTLFNYVETANVKSQLQQLGVMMSVTRTALSPAQLKQLLQNPPAGTKRRMRRRRDAALRPGFKIKYHSAVS